MWIDCGIHAREWISPAFCLWFVQYVSIYIQYSGNSFVCIPSGQFYTRAALKSMSSLAQSLSFYKINSDITDILDNMDVYVLPVMNPDGYKVTWTTVRIHVCIP